jgi:hypothetical protein
LNDKVRGTDIRKGTDRERMESMLIIRMIKMTGILFMVAVMALPAMAQGWTNRRGNQANAAGGTCLRQAGTLPAQTLSPTEVKELSYLREEEKLAHDVYQQMSLKYSIPIFQKISQSEERHFNAVKVLLDRYGLPDPAAGNGVGVFSNASLRTLYTDLVNQGNASLAAALRAGVTIEELDIRDLRLALNATDNGDLQRVYENLQQGSINHMGAFTSRLQTMGETYTAQYLDASALADIIASQTPTGANKGSRGNGRMRTGRGNGECLRLTQ